MQTKITWFIIGTVASWLTWSGISYVRMRPHDLIVELPANLQKVTDNGITWLHSAVTRKVGGVIVCASSRETDPSASIMPHGKAFPRVFISSENSDGFVDSIILLAASDQTITANLDAKGQIRNYAVSTGDILDSHSVSMVDSDMDGQFDVRIGPGRHVYLWLNSEWHERVSANGSAYVDLNGIRTEVVLTNGLWKLKKDLSQP